MDSPDSGLEACEEPFPYKLKEIRIYHCSQLTWQMRIDLPRGAT
jgi:hypothetical protein